jgi:hypothetical protein
MLLWNLLLGCAPVEASRTTASHPEGYEVLHGTGRFEPSGAVLLGNTLWVASDKPLVAHHSAVASAFYKEVWDRPILSASIPTPEDAGPKGPKLEAGAWDEASQRVVWWSTTSQRPVRCDAAMEGCLEGVSVKDALHAAAKAEAGEDIAYVSIEGMALVEGETWLGSRRYATRDEETLWPRLLQDDGTVLWKPSGKVEHEGREFAISDLHLDDKGRLWMLWSFEDPDAETRDDVAGFLARATVSGGQVTSVKRCTEVFEGKPEALIHRVGNKRSELWVLFDNDDDTKDPKGKDPNKFPLRLDQDYLWELEEPKSCDMDLGAPT